MATPQSKNKPQQQAKPTETLPAKISTTAVEAVPSYIAQHQGMTGLEALNDSNDFLMPRIALAQSLTPQAKRTDPKYIDGLVDGQFFNNVTQEVYGDKFRFIPLFAHKYRVKFKEPIGSGIDCSSLLDDKGRMYGRLSPEGCAGCVHAQFGDDGDAPECTDFKAWVVLLLSGQPAGISFKSTALKVAKQFNSQLRMAGGPAFAKVWEASCTTETKNNNTYWQWVLKPVSFVAESVFKQAEQMAANLSKKNIAMSDEPDGSESDSLDSSI